MSISEMAVLFNTSLTSWHNYETGKTMPPIDILLRISGHFHIPLDALFARGPVHIEFPEMAFRSHMIHEEQILEAYRRLSPYAQGRLLAIARSLLEDEEP